MDQKVKIRSEAGVNAISTQQVTATGRASDPPAIGDGFQARRKVMSDPPLFRAQRLNRGEQRSVNKLNSARTWYAASLPR